MRSTRMLYGIAALALTLVATAPRNASADELAAKPQPQYATSPPPSIDSLAAPIVMVADLPAEAAPASTPMIASRDIADSARTASWAAPPDYASGTMQFLSRWYTGETQATLINEGSGSVVRHDAATAATLTRITERERLAALRLNVKMFASAITARATPTRFDDDVGCTALNAA